MMTAGIILLITVILFPTIFALTQNPGDCQERMRQWLKEQDLKTVDYKTVQSPFHPFRSFIGRFELVYLVEVTNKKEEKGEIYFCFGSPLIGGLSKDMKIKWKNEIKA